MAAETTTVDLQAQTVEVLKQIQQLDFNTVLNQWIIPYGTKILLAIAIYFIGKSVARFLSGLLGKAVLRSSKDEMLQGFVGSISYFLFLLIVVIAALSQLGINTSSLVALIGAAGLAIGLALQNSLQNFAAGVMILVFKPFRKGDYIEAGGVAGVVNQIGLLVVELRTGDNKTVLVPNGKVFGDSITNYSTNETRRVDFIFDIDYSSDITAAKQIIADCLAQESRVLQNPEPTIVVGSLASNSVQLFVRPWARTADYWGVYFAITEKVKLEFDRAGIAIPFNQLNVHLDQDLVVGIEKKTN
ncbi:mechanosensitive ion channel [Testudinibacter sp. TR-2022]|uniref:mechanosensitive ion channel family protein n=1 Tax=Testudinibacter sp. TR-2022 TaxID=2585029 RepID=UPI00111B6BBE|nr:mechanosensitive ion channel domain-containing protein [Testudinibacter sp. TR-2022]TNH04488.1 mechanosensitive ion channel [Pasteurellaceae bacterium Phil31]TNH11990.1 mechanosensitive ion channel [Testudinibacter sp. TR-2022]TNH12705.1 mechanosensitive ion channel [Testudinibacter sp. TR-2022]TNH12778.1 mechanosensitive ion channel [Testudinibacter sp. TR-2022]TNH19417.1 mechanosensitive ion channel [Testudinibacter sp. TR-2022]